VEAPILSEIYELENLRYSEDYEHDVPQPLPSRFVPYSQFRKLLRIFYYNAHSTQNPVLAAANVFVDIDQQVTAILSYRSNQNPEVREWVKLTRKRRNYQPLSLKEKQQIIEMYRQGYSIYAIAKKLKRHPSTIYYFLKLYQKASL